MVVPQNKRFNFTESFVTDKPQCALGRSLSQLQFGFTVCDTDNRAGAFLQSLPLAGVAKTF